MITLHNRPVRIRNGLPCPEEGAFGAPEGRASTIAAGILSAHSAAAPEGRLSIRFDSLISHDITYVGIIQTASASGLERFPVPYVLTNCHNSLCAVGGTINADDHAFGLSAAQKYGGIFVPANMAVIHQYAREELSGWSWAPTAIPATARWGPWASARAGRSWSASFWGTPGTSPRRRLCWSG